MLKRTLRKNIVQHSNNQLSLLIKQPLLNYKFHSSLISNHFDRETEFERRHKARIEATKQLRKDLPKKFLESIVNFRFRNIRRSTYLFLIVLVCIGQYLYMRTKGDYSIIEGIQKMILGGSKKQTPETPKKQEEKASGVKIDEREFIVERIDPARMRQFVYLDVEHVDSRFKDTSNKGRIIIGLYDKVVPVTAFNFLKLCEAGDLKGTIFHRVINKFMLQGGDIKQGTGMSSIPVFDKVKDNLTDDMKEKINNLVIRDTIGNAISFKDENFELKHSEPYLICMANKGPNTNGSQFYITTEKTPHLDNKHVVFGKVLYGMQLIDDLQKVRTDLRDRPIDQVKIVNCGTMTIDEVLSQ
ncbi:hypothetical protein ABK040_000152 [Willaertia magna]